MVCGGYDENNEATNASVIVNLENEQLSIEKGVDLLEKEGFWNNQAIIDKNIVYCL